MIRSVRLLAASAILALAVSPLGAAQDTAASPPPEEEEVGNDLDSIVVTGSRVRQGGAQDIRHFRSVAEGVGMPRPESLTVEGLMGEHDLTLPAGKSCLQLFCLQTEAMTASLPTRPDDKLFVGLGFTSNIDAATWRREPLHLVAVVDKSGSMDGPPLDLVRRSLKQIVGQMRAGDRVSIILYGDESHVYLAPTDVAGNRADILAAIGRIESAGSTNMEAGLKVGYDTAFAAAPGFAGNTRLMLFTDEQPNVGNTDAESFMGMAEAASRRGIGLTTIGVGVQFDGALATRVSSVRGGNLFFVSDEAEVKSVFEGELDTMVSQLAHDVRITMKPQAGYRVSGVFGVPDGLLTEGGEGAVTITVPTAFLSTKGGGIFASLAKSGDRAHLPAASLNRDVPSMEVSLSYVGAADGKAGTDRLDVAIPTDRASEPLRLAHLLVDEYLVLKGASTAFHGEGAPKKAYALLNDFSRRMAASKLGGLGEERKLVGNMLQQAAFYAGYGGEQPPRSLRHLSVIGTWEVRASDGFTDLRRGDRLSFTSDRELMTLRPKARRGLEQEETEAYQINERQIHLPDSSLVLDYSTDRDRMTLRDESGQAELVLARVDAGDAPTP